MERGDVLAQKDGQDFTIFGGSLVHHGTALGGIFASGDLVSQAWVGEIFHDHLLLVFEALTGPWLDLSAVDERQNAADRNQCETDKPKEQGDGQKFERHQGRDAYAGQDHSN
jgi:hypothetical protein